MTDDQWVKLERQHPGRAGTAAALHPAGRTGAKRLVLSAQLNLDAWQRVDVFLAPQKIKLIEGSTYRLVSQPRAKSRTLTTSQFPWPIGTTFRVLEQSETELILEVERMEEVK